MLCASALSCFQCFDTVGKKVIWLAKHCQLLVPFWMKQKMRIEQLDKPNSHGKWSLTKMLFVRVSFMFNFSSFIAGSLCLFGSAVFGYFVRYKYGLFSICVLYNCKIVLCLAFATINELT